MSAPSASSAPSTSASSAGAPPQPQPQPPHPPQSLPPTRPGSAVGAVGGGGGAVGGGAGGGASVLASSLLASAGVEIPKFRPRACARCSTSKLKCNWVSEPGEAPCERCAKSKTECVLPSLKPRGPRRGNPTRVGQLEQKIDGIMSLLTASQQIQKGSPSQPPTPSDLLDVRDSLTLIPSSPVRSAPPPTPGTPATPAGTSHSHSQHSQTPPVRRTSMQSLQLQQQQSLPHVPPHHAPPHARTPSHASHTSHASYASHGSHPSFSYSQTPAHYPPLPPIVPPLEHVEIVPGLKITFHDAELALADYRRLCSPYFPFLPLPYGVPAHELYHRQPLLFRILVQAMVPQPPAMQRDARRWFREQLAHRIVVQEERHLGLLQAALAVLAWTEIGHYTEPRTTPLLQLAVSLVVDLGLQRPPAMLHLMPGKFGDAVAALRGKGGGSGSGGGGGFAHEHSRADMRAMLGCFYLSTLSTAFFRRCPVFPYAPYLDHCCAVLLDAREHESDDFLVALVRLQQLAKRMAVVLPNPENDPLCQPSNYGATFMAMAALRRELDAFLHSQPVELKNNFLFWANYHAVVVRLYEPAIYMRPSSMSAAAVSPTTPLPTLAPLDAAERTACLWQCLQALADFFDAQLAIPPAALGLLPFPTTSHLAFAVMTTVRLLFLGDDPDWDVARARRGSSGGLDFVAVCLRLEEQFQTADDYEDAHNAQNAQADGAHGLGRKKRFVADENRSHMALLRDRMRWIRLWYAAKLGGGGGGGGPSTSAASASTASTAGAATPGSGAASDIVPLLLPPFLGSTQGGSFMDVDSTTDDYDALFWRSMFPVDGWEPPL